MPKQSYYDMVYSALESLQSETGEGSSRIAIKKYIAEHFGEVTEASNKFINKAIFRSVEKGKIRQIGQKFILENADEEDDDGESLSDTSEYDPKSKKQSKKSKTPAKKGRGRPKKRSADEDSDDEDNSKKKKRKTTSKAASKGRGRPRKDASKKPLSKKAHQKSVEDYLNHNPDVSDTDSDSDYEVDKKKKKEKKIKYLDDDPNYNSDDYTKEVLKSGKFKKKTKKMKKEEEKKLKEKDPDFRKYSYNYNYERSASGTYVKTGKPRGRPKKNDEDLARPREYVKKNNGKGRGRPPSKKVANDAGDNEPTVETNEK